MFEFGVSPMLIIGMSFVALSGFILQHAFDFKTTLGNRITPFLALLAGVLFATELRDFSEAIFFLSAAFVQFMAFVFVSRFRQRGSFFWHAVAALGSNGAWFATVHILAGALSAENIYPLLVAPYLAGIVAGRLTAAKWAGYIERRYSLIADATRDPKLAPGKRLDYILREPMFWVLASGLAGYIVYGTLTLSEEALTALFIVVGLGLLQNFFAALGARARGRNNRTYAVATDIIGGAIFFTSATYLFSKGVPFELFVPYVFSTALGSTLGSFFSMMIEWIAKIVPDAHVTGEKDGAKTAKKASGGRGQTIVAATLGALALAWFFGNEFMLGMFGQNAAALVLPFPVPFGEALSREAIMLAIVPFFFLKNALHAVTSRAGSRNHAGYHAVACTLTGLFDFFVLSYIALNAHIVDIIPIAILVGALGTLSAMQVGEFIEKRLEAVMDVPKPRKA